MSNAFEAIGKRTSKKVVARIAAVIDNEFPRIVLTRKLLASARIYLDCIQDTYETCMVCDKWVIGKHVRHNLHNQCIEAHVPCEHTQLEIEAEERYSVQSPSADWNTFIADHAGDIADLTERAAIVCRQEEQKAHGKPDSSQTD